MLPRNLSDVSLNRADFVVFAFIAFIAAVIYWCGGEKSQAAEAWRGPDCGSDYRLCLRRNSTVVDVHNVRNVYGDRDYDTDGTIPIPIACQDEAKLRGIKHLKPGLLGAFSLAPPGGDFVDTGIARIVDGPLVCTVDLKTGLVKSVAPAP